MMSGSIDEDVHISSFHSYEMRMCIFYRQKGVIIILVIYTQNTALMISAIKLMSICTSSGEKTNT